MIQHKKNIAQKVRTNFIQQNSPLGDVISSPNAFKRNRNQRRIHEVTDAFVCLPLQMWFLVLVNVKLQKLVMGIKN